MKINSKTILISAIAFLTVFVQSTRSLAAPDRPKLILMLVIDQFRADYLTRFESRFLPKVKANGEVGGFEFLKSQSAYFPQGQYDILQSMTAPGHATVLTGAYPYQSGIQNNTWYNVDENKKVYCTEDSSSPLVTSNGFRNSGGMSPKNLNATTVGDELKNAGFPSRVVSIALKDRAAILMGGHRADLALWMDPSSYEWVSSRHYLPSGKLPDWVIQLNEELKSQFGKVYNWYPLGPGTGFSSSLSLNPKILDASLEKATYLTKIGAPESIASPYGLELTLTAAERAIHSLHLGRGQATDLLAISFSSHDLVGHQYGPNSRPMEEMTLAEDKVISRLLNTLKRSLPGGLKKTVIVLTGDHGAPPSPAWAKARSLDAHTLNQDQLTELISTQLNEKFGKPDKGNWVLDHEALQFYLNRDEIRKKQLDPARVESEAKTALLTDSRAAFVFTESEYASRKLPPGIFERQILHTFYRGRSGQVILIPKAYVIPAEKPTPGFTSHVTGYAYDRTVPILIFGPRIRKGEYASRAEVIDIAPTLAFLSGTVPPSLSEGRVLSEIITR